MYRITYIHKDTTTELPLYIPGDQDYCLTDCTLELEMGKAGGLNVYIPEDNPAREDIECLTDEVVVYRDDVEIWRGRPVTVQIDFDLTGQLTCEGILSYLYDTYYEPFEFQGSPAQLFAAIIENHNSHVESRKQFKIGEVTVEDDNDYINRSSIYYSRSLEVMTEKLINDSLGGYFRVRVESDGRYVDYLKDYDSTASQVVEYGSNILDIAEEVEYASLATVILPLGARLTDEEGMETDEYTTIASVNGGSIYYQDDNAVSTYGWICVCAEWEDVTEPSNLLSKAIDYLKQVTNAVSSFEINAVDLSLISDEQPINLGDYVMIRSSKHGINQYVELTKMTIHPLAPENDVLQFGADSASITGSQRNTERAVQSALGSLSMRVTNLTADVINAVYGNIENIIAQTVDTDYIEARIANLGYVTAQYLEANYLDANTIEANYISVESEWVVNLDAWTANINSLLSGSVGTGELQTIHLTADNVVIDDAVIFDLIATNAIIGDLLAGTIYTDYITIMSEDGSYTTKGATTQYCDADGNVRIQIGLDESGNFTFVLYSADGEGILIDENGIKASAISDGLIVNDMVADDAAISGSKLDIESVTEYLNEYGGITLEAAQVTIDGERLDYKLTQITEATNRAVTDTYTEYYQSDSPTELTGGSWSGEQPQWEEGKYIWARTTTTYGDGSVITGAAVCITGNGADGKGIESIVAYYAVGDSGTGSPDEPTLEDTEYVPAPEEYYSGDSVSMNGITYTRQPDGGIVINGRTSSTWMSYYYIYYESDITLPAGHYRLSGCPSEAGDVGCSLYLEYMCSSKSSYDKCADTGNGVEFELTEDATNVSLYVKPPSYYETIYGAVFRPSLIWLGTGVWGTEIPTPADDEYLWMGYLVTYTDGTREWTGVACLTDDSTKRRVTALETELSVVQGQISAKVSSSEVYQIVNDVIDNGLDVNALTPRNYCLLSGGYKSSDEPSNIITWGYDVNWDYFDVTANDGYIRILNKNGNYNNPYFWLGLSSEIEIDTEYTVTAVLRGNVGYNYFYAVYTSPGGGWYAYVIATDLYFGTEWTTVSFQWAPWAVSGYTLSGIGSWGWGSAGYYMDIKSIMVEKGSVSHDWVRAPEDYAVTSDITVINDKYAKITVTLDEITSDVKDLTTISTDNQLWLIDHETRITQTEDNITIEATRAMAAEPKYGTCSTAAATAAKVVSCSDFTSLTTGVTICVYFTYRNTASSPTLNVNSTGAKTIYAYGSSIASGSDYNWEAKSYVTFVYNGSQWCMVDSASLSKIAQVQVGVTELGEDMQALAEDLRTNVVTYIYESADIIVLEGDRIVIDSDYFHLAADGSLYAMNAYLEGTIEADYGHIGGFEIAGTALYNTKSALDDTSEGVYIGVDGIALGGDPAFMVDSSGMLTATKGTVGGWTLGTYNMYGGSEEDGTTCLVQVPRNRDASSGRYWVFAAGGYNHNNHGDCPFRVGSDGETHTSNLYVGESTDDTERNCIIRNEYGRMDVQVSAAGNKGLYDYNTGNYIVYKTYNGYNRLGNSSEPTSIRGSSITVSGTFSDSLYIGDSDTTSTRYVEATNSYGSVNMGVSSSSGRKGLYDASFDKWIIYSTSSGSIVTNSAIATLSVIDSDGDIDTFAAATFIDPAHEVITHINSYMYEAEEKKHLGLSVAELESVMSDAGMDPDEYDITEHWEENGEEMAAIRYEELILMLISEIQSLNTRLTTLEGGI